MSVRDLSAQERATVDRIEQAPDALGLREEVAEVLEAHRYQGSFLNSWCTCGNVEPIRRDPETGHRPAVNVAALHREHLADALLSLIERREAEAAERALRDAVSGASFGSLGAAIHKFRCTDPDCRHWDDPTYFTPRDNDAASACHNWLRDRANRIGGTR